MTNQCIICGESGELLRDCRYCTGTYCPSHSLPENHDCPGLAEVENEDQWVRDRGTNVPTYQGSDSESRPEPLNSGDVTTYGSADIEFDSSPDVAVDGSIVGEDDEDDEQTDEKTGLLPKLVSSLKFWSS